MLEVLTRRYYGNKGLTGVAHQRGRRLHVRGRRARRLARGLRRGAASRRWATRCAASPSWRAAEDAIDADIYLAWEKQPEDSDAMAAALHEVVNAHPLPAQVRRLTTTVAGRGGAVMHHHFTFRPSDAPG